MEGKQGYIFNKPVNEIIRNRVSVRTYEPRPLEEDVKNKINTYIKEIKGPFNESVRFKLIDSKEALNNDAKIGTYGVIRGVSSYVASAVELKGMSLEELGYQLENFILYATSLGLGTCWLGGTFKKGEFSKAINLKGNEILPIVTPVGYPGKNKSIVESLMRRVAGSNHRKEWKELFFNGSFNKELTIVDAGKYSEALEMVRIAPSASNKQPWRIVKDGDTFHFYLMHAKGYSSSLGFDMQRIDIGIAMCHFDLLLKEMAIEGKWQKLQPSIKVENESMEYIVSWAC